MEELANSFEKARAAGVTLLDWADTIRKQQKKA
jgi:hypothetical protein